MKKNIILFDVGNVFLKPIHNDIIELLYKERCNDISFEKFRTSVIPILDKSFLGEISFEETWEKLFDLVNITNFSKRENLKNGFKIIRNNELIKFAVKLSERFSIGIISDLSQIGFDVFQNNFEDLYKFCDYDKIFLSVHTKQSKRKNKESYFEYIRKSFKNFNAEIIFIDDELSNLENASKSGMLTIQFAGYKNGWTGSNRKLLKDIKTYIG